jgi:hypothetical protein
MFNRKATVLPNCTAKVLIPAADAGSIKESGRSIQSGVHVKFNRIADNAVFHEAGSGEFDLSSANCLNYITDGPKQIKIYFDDCVQIHILYIDQIRSPT